MEPSGIDAGLLSPVWVGTSVAAATTDAAWLAAMLDAEAALARAQAELGVLPPAAAEAIASVRAEDLDLTELAGRARDSANPVVPLVSLLTEAVGERHGDAARFVHYGSTSQDILDSAAMLVARRALAIMLADLDRVAEGLAGLVERHRHTPMAGRTLGQHAVPTTFGLRAAGWLNLVLDARSRLRAVGSSLPAQLGGAAGTLAGYVELAGADVGVALLDAFARHLGLAEPVLPWHTARTPIADLASALVLVTGALGKIALDVQIMSRTEVGEVAEPLGNRQRGGSSAMPQKRNPVLSTLIVSAARQLPGYAAILQQCLLAEEERPAGAWQAEWQPLRESLRLAGGAADAAAELVSGLRVHAERMRENLDLTGGAIVAERVAAALTPMVGRARAKEIVTEAAASGRPLRESLGGVAEIADLDLDTLLDPTRYLGAAQPLIDRALARYRTELGQPSHPDPRNGP